jgi:predicted DNA-binding protein (MmcQ/YjbR family)
MLSEAQILERLRKICRDLVEATETVTFGHPTFQVNGNTFSVLEEYESELGICVKVEKELQGIFLDDPRFFRTPYIGKHGWVTLKVYAAPLTRTEIKALVRGSYRLVASTGSRSKEATKRKQNPSAI